MDVKITMSFDESIIEKAKRFADSKNMSLSRLTEMLYKKMTASNYQSIEEFPIAEWVNQVSEGAAEYKTAKRSRKSMSKAFYKSRK